MPQAVSSAVELPFAFKRTFYQVRGLKLLPRLLKLQGTPPPFSFQVLLTTSAAPGQRLRLKFFALVLLFLWPLKPVTP